MTKSALLSRSLLLTVLLGGIAISSDLYAATPEAAASSGKAVAAESMKAKKVKPEQKEMSMEERVEARIKELHAKLKIAPEQETAWNDVVTAMRDNEKSVHELIKERHEKAETRSAIEDLESYQKIAAAHADGLTKFIQVFQPLYDSMTDEQKKNADTVFGSYEGHHHKHAEHPMEKDGAKAK